MVSGFSYQALDRTSEREATSEVSSRHDASLHESNTPSFDDFTSTGYGYQPPAYQPYEPEASPISPDAPKVKKKSFMDNEDEDDLMARKINVKDERYKSADVDREVDDAFRRAAEEDAKKDKEAKDTGAKSSWFGGWLGGKAKSPEENQTGTKAKPIKAKLGEEMSLEFDKDLKKWVNKKGGADAIRVAAPTPPPPRGPPSRTPSAMGLPSAARTNTSATLPTQPSVSSLPLPSSVNAPPSDPLSRNTSPQLETSNSSRMQRDASQSPARSTELVASVDGSGLAIAPPSRPPTGMSGVSNASSIDDLIGAPGTRKGGTARRGKKGRGYVDVMASK